MDGPIWGFIVDRWYISLAESEIAELTPEGLSVNGDFSIQQRYPKGYLYPDTEYTSAVYFSDGSVELAEEPNFEQESFDYLSISIKNTGNKKLVAVGLYKGIYTAEDLKEYRPKGYGAELVECMRYYQRSFVDTPKNNANLILAFGANSNWVQSVCFEVPMQSTPKVTLYDYITGTANAMGKWDDDSLVSDVTVGNIGNKGFCPLKYGGITPNVAYGFHYEASAEL